MRLSTKSSTPWWLGVFLALFVVASKVLNWQYLLAPALLLLVATALPHPQAESLQRFRSRFFPLATASLLLDSGRLMLLVPADLAVPLFGAEGAVRLAQFEAALGLPAGGIAYVTIPLAFLLLAIAAWPLGTPFGAFLREIGAAVRTLTAPRPARKPKPLVIEDASKP